MGLIAKAQGGDFERPDPIPEGCEIAICYSVVDLGTQRWEFSGEPKVARKVLIQWEIPAHRIEIERNDETLDLPRATSKQYTNSLHEKASLRKHLEAWRGKKFTDDELKGFDLQNLLGKACQLQIVHERGKKDPTKVYANIAAIMSLPRGMKQPEPENPLSFFSLEDFKPGEDIVIPDSIPKWVHEIIHKSDEWQDRMEADNALSQAGAADDGPLAGHEPVDGPPVDDLPF